MPPVASFISKVTFEEEEGFSMAIGLEPHFLRSARATARKESSGEFS
jgi:hypothetical protein